MWDDGSDRGGYLEFSIAILINSPLIIAIVFIVREIFK